ncbi:MAG: hypothetical protein U0930_10125 [Pirellulales bacterium]
MQKMQFPGQQSWHIDLPLCCTLCFAALAASMAIWIGGDSLQQDPDSYAQLAETLVETGTLGIKDADGVVHSTAYRPPLYPWLLSWSVTQGKLSIIAVALFHIAMMCVLSVTVFDIARRLQMAWPWIPAMLVCIDPLMIKATQQIMTELLATTLAALVWWLWLVLWPPSSMTCLVTESKTRSKLQWISLYGLGLVFGLSILARPTAAIWVAMFSLCMIRVGCICWRRRLLDVITVSIVVAICVVPWTVRNWAQLGQPIWGTTHGGYTLMLANNPSLYHHFKANGADRDWRTESFHHAWALRGKFTKEELLSDEHWIGKPAILLPNLQSDSSSLTVYSLGELHDDALAYEVAHHTIHQDLKTFAKSCIYRLGWFWSCWPNGVGKAQTAVIGTWYAGLFALALMGLRKACANFESFVVSWLPVLTLMIVLSCVHSAYWSNMRMRCPLMPCIYMLAVVALRSQIRIETCERNSTDCTSD